MTAILGILSALAPVVLRGWNLFGSAATASATIIAAAFGALPGVLNAVAGSPLLAFLLAASLAGPAGYVMRWNSEAPRIQRIKDGAISAANKRADIVLAKASGQVFVCSKELDRTRVSLQACTAKRR